MAEYRSGREAPQAHVAISLGDGNTIEVIEILGLPPPVFDFCSERDLRGGNRPSGIFEKLALYKVG